MSNESSEFKQFLRDSKILMSESKLSYIDCLMRKFETTDKTLLLHKEPTALENIQRKTTDSEELLQLSDLDITGSPLEYGLNYSKADETIVDNKNWSEEEESHLPLTKSEAWIALNHYCEYFNDENSASPLVVAVCNGKNKEKTILLGNYIQNGWFTTLKTCVFDPKQLSTVEELPERLFREYMSEYTVPEHEIRKTVSSTYELCGKRPGLVNSFDFPSDGFNGSLSIKRDWNTLCFRTPMRTSTSTLIMEISAGWNGSNLQNLWTELKLLHEYFSILEQRETSENIKNEEFISSNNIISEEIREKLISLLNGEKLNDVLHEDDRDDNHPYINDDIKLKTQVDNARFRQNTDFADMLWELLIESPDYFHALNCIRFVLWKIQSDRANPQINLTNPTRINKMISEILYQKGALPTPNDKLALEILIDTGLAKITRDYSYILFSANLIDLYGLRKTLNHVQTEIFDIESYRKNLTSLSRIHLCLEFALFAQNHINCSTANLRSIFTSAFQNYVSNNSPIQSFQDLNEKSLRYLEVPLHNDMAEVIAEGLPSSWCLTLSSESAFSKLTDISYLSRTPIIPPNIYAFDELNVDQGYHVLKLNLSSTKIA